MLKREVILCVTILLTEPITWGSWTFTLLSFLWGPQQLNWNSPTSGFFNLSRVIECSGNILVSSIY